MIRIDLPLWILLPYLFVLGATVGSFLNVCVHRFPKSERLFEQLRGLWSPPSHCPRCGKRILLRDNIPVIGWIALRGRCRFCRLRISYRYPLVEAANGLLWVVVFLCEVPTGFFATIHDSSVYSPLGPQGDLQSWLTPTMVVLLRWLYHMVLIESLLVASLIDLELRIIPDGATLPAMAVGVLCGWLSGCVYLVPVWFQDTGTLETLSAVSGAWLSPFLHGPAVPAWIAAHPHLHGLAVSLAGLIVGGGSIWIVRLIGHFVLKREAMGFGDVILMAMIGSFIGWQPVLVVFFAAPVCALVLVAAAWIFRRDREIPYGPFLSLATLAVVLGWQHVWPSAERLFGLGPFVPLIGAFMVALLFACLQVMQWTKRLLGIPDFIDEGENPWESGDQLFHFARQNGEAAGWRLRQWPGIGAGRGSLCEQHWRRGPGDR